MPFAISAYSSAAVPAASKYPSAPGPSQAAVPLTDSALVVEVGCSIPVPERAVQLPDEPVRLDQFPPAGRTNERRALREPLSNDCLAESCEHRKLPLRQCPSLDHRSGALHPGIEHWSELKEPEPLERGPEEKSFAGIDDMLQLLTGGQLLAAFCDLAMEAIGQQIEAHRMATSADFWVDPRDHPVEGVMSERQLHAERSVYLLDYVAPPDHIVQGIRYICSSRQLGESVEQPSRRRPRSAGDV